MLRQGKTQSTEKTLSTEKKLSTEKIHFTQKTQGKENTQRTVETRDMEYIKGDSKGVDYDREGTGDF